MSFVDALIAAFAAVGFGGSVWFMAAYHSTTDGNWRTATPAGPVMMTASLILSTLFLLIMANRLIPGWKDWEPKDWLLAAVYAGYAFTPYSWIWLLRQAQRPRGEDTSHDLRP